MKMATKIQQILETAPNESVLFGSWLSSQGLDARGQYAYMKSGGFQVRDWMLVVSMLI